METIEGNNVVQFRSPTEVPLQESLRSGSEVVMTSLQIAEVCGKIHKNVLVDIRNMLDSLNNLMAENPAVRFDGGISQSTYEHRGRVRELYVLDKRMTLALVSGYRLDLRLQMIDRIEQLEKEQRERVPVFSMESIEALIEQKISERLLALPQSVVIPVPHVSSTLHTARVRPSLLGHRLGVSATRMNRIMERAGIQTRVGTNWVPTRRASGLFEIDRKSVV
mgnify:FL=1